MKEVRKGYELLGGRVSVDLLGVGCWCKGPKVGACLKSLKKSKETSVGRVELAKGREIGGNIRVLGARLYGAL